MKDFLYFIMGAAVGALVALIMAPKSGQELRGDLQQRANVDFQKVQQSYEQRLQEVNQKTTQIQTQLKKKQQMGEELVEELKADDEAAPAAPAA